jgi:hypothetical protein
MVVVSRYCLSTDMVKELTMELVKVAGTATTIHHTILTGNPVLGAHQTADQPAIQLRHIKTDQGSNNQEYTVADEKPQLLAPPSRYDDFEKPQQVLENSGSVPPFFDVASPSPVLVPARLRASACRMEAALCSEMAFRIRLIKAMKSVR